MPRVSPPRALPALCLLALIAVAALPGGRSGAVAARPEAAVGASLPSTVAYHPPVDGPVVEPFRPPASPYAAGNRGLDYATAPGAPVWAAAAGEVVFAGAVAGTLHVTLLHADGLRTSYSFLASVDVAVGRHLAAGEVVGTSAGRLHFGVRLGTTYLDPASLLTGQAPRVRLVPEPTLPSGGVRAEGLALLRDVVGAAAPGPSGPWAHYLRELRPRTRLLRIVRGTSEAWWSDHGCTPEHVVVPPPAERRIVVLVGGLGTTSERSSVDRLATGALGYEPDDVVRFSYAGGRTPAGPASGPLAALPATRYDSLDSQQDLLVAAERLRDLLATVAARQPGVPIDVIAHSQGGVVAQVATSALASGPPLPPELDLVATLGSPHDGADLATAVEAVGASPEGQAYLDDLEARLGLGLEPDAPSVAQLSETSVLMAALADQPPPTGVRRLTVAARGDLTVPAVHSRLPGAPRAVVDLVGPDAHTRLPGDPATTRELTLALAGQPPACDDRLGHLVDAALPEAISWGEDLLGASAALFAGAS